MRDDFLIRLRRLLRRAQQDERGSVMVMALLLMLVFAVAGVTLATVIGVNARLTLQTSSRGTSVYIAEAGLETTLGTFRAATGTTSGIGDLRKLPCQLTGSADGSIDPEQQFVVTIRYGLEDPSAHATDAGWLAANNTAAVNATPNGFSPVNCVTAASGTAGPVRQPYYALVEAAAAHGEVGARTLLAVYSFNIDTSHSTSGQTGGEILVYNQAPGATLCLRAESATMGSLIRYSTNCDRSDAANSALVGWLYDDDYKIRLAATVKADDPDTPSVDESKGDLCIAAPPTIPTVTTTTTYVYNRWDYSLPQTGTNASGNKWQATGAKSTSEVGGDPTDPTTVFLTADPTAGAPTNPLDLPYSTGGGGTAHHYYYIKGTPTASSLKQGSTTPHAGETTRNEKYIQYAVTYAQNSPTGTTTTRSSDLTTGSTTYYLRFVTATVTVTTTTGGGYVGQGSYTSPTYPYPSYSIASAVLVSCNSPYKALDLPVTADNPTGTYTVSSLKDLQWGWEASNSWQSGNGWCLYSGRSSGNPQNGDLLKAIQSCAVSAQTPYAAFNPLTGVGAGGASGATSYSYGASRYAYLVNFQEFGRCADVNGQNYTSWMIVYPCKQNPNSPAPEANQGWSFTEPVDPAYISSTQIFIRDSKTGGTNYCLVEPSGASHVNSSASVAAPRVQLVKDTSGYCSQDAAKWTRYTWTGRYASSYIIVSHSGLCLTADSTTSDTTAGFPWSTMTVQGCNGQANQKWNAPPDLPLGGLGDYQEIPAGGTNP